MENTKKAIIVLMVLALVALGTAVDAEPVASSALQF